MSTRWMVSVECDRCGERSLGADADRAVYGEKLAKLRALLAQRGWTASKIGGPNPHRDYCPECSRARG